MLDRPEVQPQFIETEAFKALIERYGDRDLRMNTLYYVLDEDGNRMLYRRRPAQQSYADDHWLLDIIVKARQLGFCLSPETRILSSDLEWIRLGEIKPGQSIMAVDEDAPKVAGSARKLRIAYVEKVWDVFEDAYEI